MQNAHRFPFPRGCVPFVVTACLLVPLHAAAPGNPSTLAARELEKRRAAIWEVDLASGATRQYAAGLRNPNGLGWNPSTGELWTVVNERDQIGPNLPPDYLTNVPVGAHYGWPWVYWKDVIDDRVEAPMPDYLTDYTRKPEYALGPHTAPLENLMSGCSSIFSVVGVVHCQPRASDGRSRPSASGLRRAQCSRSSRYWLLASTA